MRSADVNLTVGKEKIAGNWEKNYSTFVYRFTSFVEQELTVFTSEPVHRYYLQCIFNLVRTLKQSATTKNNTVIQWTNVLILN
jgi:hypothetical protein